MRRLYLQALLGALCLSFSVHAAPNRKPVASVVPAVYVQDYARISAQKCYDPDGDPLQFHWRQISGTDQDFSWYPTTGYLRINGLTPTDEIQRATYELTVSDGQLWSDPATLEVVVVPDFNGVNLVLKSGYFSPDKPTILAFGAGNGTKSRAWVPEHNPWLAKANWFSNDTNPPYEQFADFIIYELSRLAPDYKQPIQTLGFSSGALPTMAVSTRLNLVYGDPQYMVNRVTIVDAIAGTTPATEDLMALSQTTIDGETCWIDNYSTGSLPVFFHVRFPGAEHFDPLYWYQDSAKPSYWPHGPYNNGITAGYYVSIIGPAKNLYIPPTDPAYYFFEKKLDEQVLGMHSETLYPGHLPEPVNLIGPDRDPNGILLTCQLSAHATRYELLIGADPHCVAHYDLVYEANEPPTLRLQPEALPYQPAWGTIRVRNAYDATIHADPVLLTE